MSISKPESEALRGKGVQVDALFSERDHNRR
jgi:hypothetical protein